MTWKRTGNGPETWRVVGVGGKVFRGLYLEVSTSFSQEILSEFGRWDLQVLGSALNISSPSRAAQPIGLMSLRGVCFIYYLFLEFTFCWLLFSKHY
jgi:hypothetical protein